MRDVPVFKRLAHNDTGAAKGHQAGIVIPKDIADFFPLLDGGGTKSQPTTDKRFDAELYVDDQFVGRGRPRYQYQTWGGTRPPERRLTDELKPMRDVATAGDIVLFFKDLADDDRLEIRLHRKGTEAWSMLDRTAGSKNWGWLDSAVPPVSLKEIIEAQSVIADEAGREGSIFSDGRTIVMSRTERLARNRAFRLTLLQTYRSVCAVTGRSFAHPGGAFGLDAAHIVPVALRGSDHPVNGFILTKDLHWAFDAGLFAVGEDRRVIVPNLVARLPGNEFLAGLNGRPIAEAVLQHQRASDEAFAWHRENRLLR
jgi:putative restriction endonuclease